MNVCMIAYTFYETDNRVRRYADALVKRGDRVDAIVLRREGQSSFEVINGVHVCRIQKRSRNERDPLSYLIKLLLFFLRSAWVVSVRYLSKTYDIIHVHSVPDFEVFATAVPRLFGARVILDIHDIVPEFYASKFGVNNHSVTFRLLMVIEKLSAAYSHHVIIANHLWYARLTQRSVAPKKCTAIINYPDSSIFFPRVSTADSKEFVICYPGTLNSHQGVDVAVNAVALLRDEIPNLKFLIVGDGPERERLRLLIAQLGIQGRVELLGSIPLERVADLMARANLGVVPKRKDSFGNEAFSTKILEFMAMGVPVVVSRTRVDQYYFTEQLLQFFESGDATDLAAKIRELVHNPNKCRELRAHAANFIRYNTWELKKHEYLSLVDHLVKKDPFLPMTSSRAPGT